jgi:hypothetical protein
MLNKIVAEPAVAETGVGQDEAHVDDVALSNLMYLRAVFWPSEIEHIPKRKAISFDSTANAKQNQVL